MASKPKPQARARETGPGEVLKAFEEVARMPVEQRRAELLKRLDVIWESAMSKAYVNKHGESVPSPDHMSALKCVEVADAMLVELEGKQERRANLMELSMFKSPERKAG